MNPNIDRASDDRDFDDEIDFKPYLVALWRFKFAIVAIALVSGIVAYLTSRAEVPTFQARTQLIVTSPKGEDMAGATNVATFRALLDNQTLAAQVITDMGFDKQAGPMTPSQLLGHLSIETVSGTSILSVSARMSTARQAAAVANQFANRAVEMARRLSQEESLTTRNVLKGQLDQARKRFDQAEASLASYKKEAQVDLVREDVDTLLDQRGELIRLLVDIEGEKARLARAEEEIARQEQVRTAPSAANTAAMLTDAARQAALEEGAQRQQLASRQTERDARHAEERQKEQSRNEQGTPRESQEQPRPNNEREQQQRQSRQTVEAGRQAPVELRSDALNPFVNPVYELLNQQIAMSRTRLAALERQRTQLASTLKLNGSQLDQLSDLYRHQTEIARLETEYDLAKKIYLEVATRYEQAEIQVVGRSAQLQVLDQAYPPEGPIAPQPRRVATFALAAGFVASVLAVIALVVLRNALGSHAPAKPART